MDNVLKQLQKLYNTPGKWNYYNIPTLENPFERPEFQNSKQFIKEFLAYSDKVKNIYDVLELIEPYRNLHIVTDYFLGILLYENNTRIKIAIDNQIKKIIPPENESLNNSFKYFWFLICFYHDVGYYYENNNDSIISLSTLEEELKIENKIQNLIGVPKLFQHITKKYLLYRFEMFHCYDHGIIGGMLLYDRLIKVYKNYKHSFGNGQNSFMHNNLYWSDSMFKYFQLIASVVLTHNIWFRNESSNSLTEISIYKDYRLDKLIISDATRAISLERHPLLFLLSLVDSIEPTKCFGIHFLKKNRFIFSKNNTIIIAQNICNDDETNKWRNTILSLSSWLKVDTNELTDSYVEIIP